jgi:Leucine-rich repeat (LRR) protein
VHWIQREEVEEFRDENVRKKSKANETFHIKSFLYRLLSNLIAYLAIVQFTVQASDGISCNVQERKRWIDPGFSRGKNNPPFTTYYDCTFGNDVTISNANTKLSNERNEEVNEINANNITGLEYLPIDIVDAFPNIRKLSFDRTNLKAVSKKNFHGLSKLGYLNINRNQISSIDEDTFDDLESIFWIHLDDNKLTTLPPKVFSKLATLDTLYLNGNQLTALDAGTFKNNHKLAILIMDNNKFTTFAPDMFSSQILMRQIWLHNNEISSLNSDWFKTCASLIDVSFSDNKITEIPLDLFTGLTSFRRVSFSRNPITSIDFKLFETNKEINDIAFNGIKVEKVLNIDVVDKLSELQGVHFEINDNSCIIGSYHEGTLKKLKEEVKENCKTE